MHKLPLSPRTIAIWSEGDHVLATAELVQHDEVGLVAVNGTAFVKEIEGSVGGVEEDEGLRKDAYVGDGTVFGDPSGGGEPKLCGGEIEYVAYDGEGLWTRWKGSAGISLAFCVPEHKQREHDEGQGDEHGGKRYMQSSLTLKHALLLSSCGNSRHLWRIR